MSEFTPEIETYFDSVAAVLVCRHRQRMWWPNLAHIAAVGEALGLSDVYTSGKAESEILQRMGALNATLPAKLDRKARRAAEITAETQFGPRGELAANFMIYA